MMRALPLASIALLMMVGLEVTLSAASPGPTAEVVGLPSPPDTTPGRRALSRDPRVLAFLEAFGSHIDAVSYTDHDALFLIGGRTLHFQDGRMLGEEHLEEAGRFDPFFYAYSLEPLTAPPSPPRPSPPTPPTSWRPSTAAPKTRSGATDAPSPS